MLINGPSAAHCCCATPRWRRRLRHRAAAAGLIGGCVCIGGEVRGMARQSQVASAGRQQSCAASCFAADALAFSSAVGPRLVPE